MVLEWLKKYFVYCIEVIVSGPGMFHLLSECLYKLGFKRSLASVVKKEYGNVSARCSYVVYLNRYNLELHSKSKKPLKRRTCFNLL